MNVSAVCDDKNMQLHRMEGALYGIYTLVGIKWVSAT